MSLQFIIGSAGSGKSHVLYNEMIEQSIACPDMNYIAIVPEQFTMQTQKDIVTMHPRKGVMNIDIVSFQRLAFRVFEEVGKEETPILDDTGKNLILRKVIENKKSELGIFSGKLKKPGFTEEMKSMISELYQYGVTDSDLKEMLGAAEKKPLLEAKLKDVFVLYQGFKEYLEDKYITSEELLQVLCNVVPKSNRIRNSVISLDGFTGFTPIQYKLIGTLLQYAKKVIVTVTLDPREDPHRMDEEHRLFHLSKETIHKLVGIAEELKVPIEKDNILQDEVPYRFRKSKALACMEKNLFRYGRLSQFGEQNEISLHIARNPAKEAEFVVKEIMSLVREKGYRYRDIAVITGDMDRYYRVLENLCEESRIPCFIDHKRSLIANPFVDSVRAALEVIEKDFSYESVFRYLRCGMTNVTQVETDLLENYVIALGIRGRKKWNEKWLRRYKTQEKTDLELLNQLREKVITPLLVLRSACTEKEATVKDFTTALYELIVSQSMQEKLDQYHRLFAVQGELSLSKEYAQTYRLVMELFDKLVSLLGDEIISLKEYRAILDAGFSEIKVGVIPPSIDQLVIGDMERTRLKDIKVLFLIGVNDGIIPKNGGKAGILSELDRDFLTNQKFELAPTTRQSGLTQKFYLYLNLMKPSERLYLSYSKMSSEGKAVRPSYLAGTIRKLFPLLSPIDEELEALELNYITTDKKALRYLTEGLSEYGLREMNELWKELYTSFYSNPEYHDRLIQLVEAAFYQNKELKLGKAVASALYGSTLMNSVTRLEHYASCAYAHFLSYGLALTERSRYEIEAVDLGNLFHNSIERFSQKLAKSSFDWRTLTEDARRDLVKDSVNEVTTDYGNSILLSSMRNSYLMKRVVRITERTVWALGEQIKKGKFNPEFYELSFTPADDLKALQFDLDENRKMMLNGRIDRIDTFKEDDCIYVKIIDYKSGNTSFQISDVYYGLQMQLILYMDAALELTKKKHPESKVIPAGIFYYNIKDPIVEKESLLEASEPDQIILKELKMNGLVNSEEKVISLLDSEMDKDSDVIPVSYTKNGMSKRSSVASEEEFRKLMNYLDQKIQSIGKEILDGNIELNPYQKGIDTPCRFCPYQGVCGFDVKIPGNQYRKLCKLKPEDVWTEIQGEED